MAKKGRRGPPSVTDQLRERVRGTGHTLTEIARRSGVSLSQLSRFMRGERDLTGDSINKLCAALGLRLTEEGGAGPGAG
jgi:transcriptional regulator with XRE-family HTH domain